MTSQNIDFAVVWISRAKCKLSIFPPRPFPLPVPFAALFPFDERLRLLAAARLFLVVFEVLFIPSFCSQSSILARNVLSEKRKSNYQAITLYQNSSVCETVRYFASNDRAREVKILFCLFMNRY